MKQTIFTLTAIACAMQVPSASAALIAGSDFSDSAVFDAAGGAYDSAATSTDDLNPTDNVTVTDWSFAGGANPFGNLDANAQVNMPSDNVTKIDGDANALPAVGSVPGADFNSVSFSINIPLGTTVDLTSVDWVSRQATGGNASRWVAFNTSLDSTLIYSAIGTFRDALDFDAISVDLTGAAYQGITDTSVTFNWYAGGGGSGDMDFDTATVNGTVTQVPEPSAVALFGLAGLAAFMRRRR